MLFDVSDNDQLIFYKLALDFDGAHVELGHLVQKEHTRVDQVVPFEVRQIASADQPSMADGEV